MDDSQEITVNNLVSIQFTNDLRLIVLNNTVIEDIFY